MQKLKEMIKPGDIIILVVLLLVSFLPLLIFYLSNSAGDDDYNIATVSVDGEVIKSFELVDDDDTETYEYKDEDGDTNIIVRQGEEIGITYANCGDQICVRQGNISEVGETIVCLPHKLIVEVRANNPGSTGNDIDIVS